MTNATDTSKAQTLARFLAKQWGPDFIITRTDSVWCHEYVLASPKWIGRLFVRSDIDQHNKRGRVEVAVGAGAYPEYRPETPCPETITMSESKTVEQLAAEVERRLMPAAREYAGAVDRQVAQEARDKAAWLKTSGRFNRLGLDPPQNGSTTMHLSTMRGGGYGELRLDTADSGRLTLSGHAEQLIGAVQGFKGTAAKLADALRDLMAQEGSEPRDDQSSRGCWSNARAALREYDQAGGAA